MKIYSIPEGCVLEEAKENLSKIAHTDKEEIKNE